MSEEHTHSADRYLLEAVRAAGGAFYHWDVASDRMTWSDNVRDVLDVGDLSLIESGRAYARLLGSEEAERRLKALLAAARAGEEQGGADGKASRSFCVEYALRPRGRGSATVAHVEDCGCWQPGADGRPAHVYGIVRRIDSRRRLEEQVELFGQYDAMTGLLNRGRLNTLLEEAIARAERGEAIAFLLASVDNLEVIADAYGHAVADDVVRIVGRRLRRVARSEDVVARYADAKFGLILHDCREEDLQVAMGRFLAVANERMIETGSGPVWARLSIGAALLPDHARTRDEAVAAAEEALAEASSRPLFRGVIYRPEPNRISQRVLNARCAAEVVQALRHNHFTLAFQPIVDARSERPVMHESLLRLRTQDGEVLSAGHLIPVAEKLGLIRLVDYNVLELAAATLRAYPEARLTMNISGITTGDPQWNGRFLECLEANADIADRLVVEIAETTVLNGLAETADFIAALREHGCRVAIDHFGAGYSSHKNLKVLDVDIVKLDGSFCENLSDNLENQYFVRSLIDMARKMELKVVAEWVQTEADAAMLRDWGVDYMQGHLFGVARIDDPWPSPSLEGEPGILARLEAPEELADLASPLLASVTPPPARDRSGLELPATPATPRRKTETGNGQSGDMADGPAEPDGAQAFASFVTTMPRTEVADSLLPPTVELADKEKGMVPASEASMQGTAPTCEELSPEEVKGSELEPSKAPLFGHAVSGDTKPTDGSAADVAETGSAESTVQDVAAQAQPCDGLTPQSNGKADSGSLKGLEEITALLNAELDSLRRMLQDMRMPQGQPALGDGPGEEESAAPSTSSKAAE